MIDSVSLVTRKAAKYNFILNDVLNALTLRQFLDYLYWYSNCRMAYDTEEPDKVSMNSFTMAFRGLTQMVNANKELTASLDPEMSDYIY